MSKKIALIVIAIIILGGIGYWIYQSMIAPEELTEKEKACTDSGGEVKTAMCCQAVGDFPNLCLVGPCGCAPENSHQVKVCDCGSNKCFNGDECILLPDELFALLEDLEQATGIDFSEIYLAEFKWVVAVEPEVEEIDIAGKGFEASRISTEQYDSIESFFTEEGFEKDSYNIAAGTVSGLTGYIRSELICTVAGGFTGFREATGQWIPPEPDKKDVEVKCGRLEETVGETVEDELTLEEIKNAEYYVSTFKETVQLKDGLYQEEQSEMASVLSVIIYKDQQGEDKVAFGDLNGDRKEDAAVVLVSSGGGSGSFRELAIMINENGKPFYLASKDLGDRVIVESINIETGVITLEMTVHGPEDPLCCPTFEKIGQYQLSDDQLVEI